MNTLKKWLRTFFRAPLNAAVNLWERGESAICLIEHGGKYLFIRTISYPTLWALPGGMVKRNEDPKNAIAREVREETGLEIQNVVLFGEQRSERRGRVKSRTHCFLAEAQTGEIVMDESELIEAKWFPKDAIPRELSLSASRGTKLFWEYNTYPQAGLRQIVVE